MIQETKTSVVYVGDGRQRSFPFPYRYYDAKDVVGYVENKGKWERITGNYEYHDGEKSYEYPTTGAPLAKGVKLKLARETKQSQEYDFAEESVEKALDKITMILQEINRDGLVQVGVGDFDGVIPAGRPFAFLQYNADASGFDVVDLPDFAGEKKTLLAIRAGAESAADRAEAAAKRAGEQVMAGAETLNNSLATIAGAVSGGVARIETQTRQALNDVNTTAQTAEDKTKNAVQATQDAAAQAQKEIAAAQTAAENAKKEITDIQADIQNNLAQKQNEFNTRANEILDKVGEIENTVQRGEDAVASLQKYDGLEAAVKQAKAAYDQSVSRLERSMADVVSRTEELTQIETVTKADAQAAKDARQGAETAASTANSAATKAGQSETAAKSAQNAAETANTEAQAANTAAQDARQNAEAAAGTAGGAATSATQSAGAARSAQDNAQAASAKAQTASTKAETANTEAQKAKTAAEKASTSAEAANRETQTASTAAQDAAAQAQAANREAQSASALAASTKTELNALAEKAKKSEGAASASATQAKQSESAAATSAEEAKNAAKQAEQIAGGDFLTTAKAETMFADKDDTATALKGKANATDVYTKIESDEKYLQKTDKIDAYTKTEADTTFATKEWTNTTFATKMEAAETFATKEETNTKASADDVYTKTQADERYLQKTDKIDAYTKAETDATFATRTEVGTKANTTDVYTRKQSDGRYMQSTYANTTFATKTQVNAKANAADVYTKADADTTFQRKGSYISIAGANARFQPKGDYLIKGDAYTKPESDAKYQLKGTYASVEYVDGRVANIVNSAPETLDTLQELAEALGNDPNFATTVANEIGTKADKATTENALKGKANAADVYTKTESNERYELKGNSIDFNELARRIPSWQWKVTLPKSDHQTVTATVDEQTYTSDFYAPQGSVVTFSVKADSGYAAGVVSPKSTRLTRDLAALVTDAVERDAIEAGSRTITKPRDTVSVKIPPNICTVKMTANSVTKFVRVEPQGTLRFFVADTVGSSWGPTLAYDAPGASSSSPSATLFYNIFGTYLISGSIVIEWSGYINEHAIDYDLTK